MSTEHEDIHDEDELEDDPAPSIFSAGWFRAVLVLTVLAIGIVVALPYLLNWFESPPPPTRAATRPTPTSETPVAPIVATGPAGAPAPTASVPKPTGPAPTASVPKATGPAPTLPPPPP